MSQESTVSTRFCTDEDIAVQAGDDFAVLSAKLPRIAFGTDGAITGGAWLLTSVSVNFATNGAASNQVVHVWDKNTFKGGGELFAVDSASVSGLTVRWPGQASTAGQSPGGITDVGPLNFEIRTFSAQIESVSYELYQRFGIDENVLLRGPDQIYDARVLQRAAVLSVLYRRYASATRSKEGDFAGKMIQVKADLDAALSACQVRWGPRTGNVVTPSSLFGTRLTR